MMRSAAISALCVNVDVGKSYAASRGCPRPPWPLCCELSLTSGKLVVNSGWGSTRKDVSLLALQSKRPQSGRSLQDLISCGFVQINSTLKFVSKPSSLRGDRSRHIQCQAL